VARAQRDPAAFAPLYARYAERVYWYAYHRLGDREAAQDAASATFAKALAALGSCREGHFRAWLYTLARNTVTDGLRERRDRARRTCSSSQARCSYLHTIVSRLLPCDGSVLTVCTFIV